MHGRTGRVLFVLGSALLAYGILRLVGTIPVRTKSLGVTVACMSPIRYLSSSTVSPRAACVPPIDHATAEAIAATAVGFVFLVVAGIIGLSSLGD